MLHLTRPLCSAGRTGFKATVRPSVLQVNRERRSEKYMQRMDETDRKRKVAEGKGSYGSLSEKSKADLDPYDFSLNRNASKAMVGRLVQEDYRAKRKEVNNELYDKLMQRRKSYDELNIWFNPAQQLLSKDETELAKEAAKPRKKRSRRMHNDDDVDYAYNRWKQ